ncbi:hypothetical protein GGX14DRAFT_403735 [Mycena pura]|uniref:Uncharacterized protein n=1 Tax=Mycena pura TaxID=153505 RepID=A0AAD6UZL2_9AGAR|nr:hypothetical protein GGX14DRAFT_403735 [Mycena pura]
MSGNMIISTAPCRIPGKRPATPSWEPQMTVTAPFHETVHAGDSIRTNFSSALAVADYASINYGQEIYSVFLNNEMSQIYSGSTFLLVPDTVIFFQSGLEPMTVYAVNIINMSGGGRRLLGEPAY